MSGLKLKLIVGLGNYPKEYHYTRHNIGFLVVDAIRDGNFTWQGHNGVDLCDFSNWDDNKKFNGYISSGVLFGTNCLLLKPKTYMNLSGESVIKVVNFYKIDAKDIIVIHDEADVEFGKIKVSNSMSSAGHNGIKSINQCLKTTYNKIRIGIGRPRNTQQELSDYVLSKFTNDEMEAMPSVFANSILTLKTLL